MREYQTPLEERLRVSRYAKDRRNRDPEWRLRKLNQARVWQGLKPRASVEEIGTVADGARNRRRAPNGRYL